MTADVMSQAWHRERAWLGYAGLMPFVAAIAMLATSDDAPTAGLAVDLLRYYAAVIASFLGAVHWGIAFSDSDRRHARLRWGVMPALLAWTLLLLPAGPALGGFVILFAMVLFVDWRVLPVPDAGYRRLRVQLSTGVILTLGVAAVMVAGNPT